MDNISNSENFVFDIEECIIETCNHFDVFIRDFDEKKISNVVSSFLDVSYLSKAVWPPTLPVFGVIHGMTNRLFVNLAVRYKQYEPINVIFLVDTGSPLTYITDATFKSLSQGNEIFDGETCGLNIHGRIQVAGRSDLPTHHFNGVNLLGANYLKSSGLILTADYTNEKVKLEKGQKNDEI